MEESASVKPDCYVLCFFLSHDAGDNIPRIVVYTSVIYGYMDGNYMYMCRCSPFLPFCLGLFQTISKEISMKKSQQLQPDYNLQKVESKKKEVKRI